MKVVFDFPIEFESNAIFQEEMTCGKYDITDLDTASPKIKVGDYKFEGTVKTPTGTILLHQDDTKQCTSYATKIIEFKLLL